MPEIAFNRSESCKTDFYRCKGAQKSRILKKSVFEKAENGPDMDFLLFSTCFSLLLQYFELYGRDVSVSQAGNYPKIAYLEAIYPYLFPTACFKMAKFAKMAKIPVINVFSQGAEGSKNRKKLIFSKSSNMT